MTAVGWVIGVGAVVFVVWEIVRRFRAAAAHLQHCIETFEPTSPAGGQTRTPLTSPRARTCADDTVEPANQWPSV